MSSASTLRPMGALLLAATCCLVASNCLARNLMAEDEPAVIPSPNELLAGDESADIQRTSAMPAAHFAPAFAASSSQQQLQLQQQQQQQVAAAASDEASVPVYASPFVRSERSSAAPVALAPVPALIFERQESSHAPPNYAPRPLAGDLKAAASYGHGGYGGGHGYGYDSHGWLDMGAWTGGKGSFGWYADYPVGGKHHYGRK